MDVNKEAKTYLNKYFKAQYLEETDDEYKALVRLLKKALRQPPVISSVCYCKCGKESKSPLCYDCFKEELERQQTDL